ncbi:MAG: hypothetical protein JNL98_24895 [Bryobacterales bacterium]|nr:hypothetical protein [Bryobacterales bacterium]
MLASQPRRAEEREAYEQLLASGLLQRAPNLERLLRYVCGKYFDGAVDQIKEYNVAVEALGRPASFDQKKDSIVRVEAHRLRKRLREYYASEGSGLPVEIVLPEGGYVPEFRFRQVSVEENSAGEVPMEAPEAMALLAVDSAAPGTQEPDTPALAQPGALAPVRPAVNPATSAPPAPARRVWPVWGIVAGIVLLAAAAVLITRGFQPSPGVSTVQSPAPDPSAAKVAARPVSGQDTEIRILAGRGPGRYRDRYGSTWEGDRYFTGGEATLSQSPVIGYDANVYSGAREGDFRYEIPVEPRPHEVHLMFAETQFGEGNPLGGGESSRVFNVLLNGQIVLGAFDVINDAAGINRATARVFKDVRPAKDGKIRIEFQSLPNNNPNSRAFVNAILLRPMLRERHMHPIRMVSRGEPHRDGEGNVWRPDAFVFGGQQITRAQAPSASQDGERFRGERYGNFAYRIPVGPGRYRITFSFAETWFGPSMPGAGGVKSRVFGVACNRRPLLNDFDIFKEAGGAQKGIVRSFGGIEPDALGKLVIEFTPQANYACVNAVEILDETP